MLHVAVGETTRLVMKCNLFCFSWQHTAVLMVSTTALGPGCPVQVCWGCASPLKPWDEWENRSGSFPPNTKVPILSEAGARLWNGFYRSELTQKYLLCLVSGYWVQGEANRARRVAQLSGCELGTWKLVLLSGTCARDVVTLCNTCKVLWSLGARRGRFSSSAQWNRPGSKIRLNEKL